MAEGEVGAFVLDCVVEVDGSAAAALLGEGEGEVVGDEGGLAEGGPEFQVGVLGEGVEVGADGAVEEGGVLGDDGEAGAEVLQADAGDVLVVDYYGACGGYVSW